MSGAGPDAANDALAHRPMHRVQIIAVVLAVLLNALDGFDVLAITFAAPGIAADWGIGPARLGLALSAGMVGMTIGSLVLAPLGDRRGRRPLVLVCLVLMGGGMALTATATGLASLCLWRVVTGIGIGGMVAAANAVAAEFANERRRDFCVAAMAVGYPAGGLVGGFAVADLAATQGWQAIFVAGGIVTLAFVPVVYAALPESLAFLAGANGSPEKLAALARRLDLPALPAAPAERARSGSIAALFGARYRRLTLLLVAAYFLHILAFYFFSGWLPKAMADLGHAAPDAIRTSALMSLGGVIGGALLGWAAPRLGLHRLLIAAMLVTSASFAAFALLTDLSALQPTAFVAGMGIFGGIVGLYALLARGFPARAARDGNGLRGRRRARRGGAGAGDRRAPDRARAVGLDGDRHRRDGGAHCGGLRRGACARQVTDETACARAAPAQGSAPTQGRNYRCFATPLRCCSPAPRCPCSPRMRRRKRTRRAAPSPAATCSTLNRHRTRRLAPTAAASPMSAAPATSWPTGWRARSG
ncbi:MFS transporter [Sphingomonas spermidinifaciens]|uniref:MFS transporter n=1 Tax=Sphingomonas spermidinifaciens TaxID=1141889 RepID=A0A2A4B0M8_9SPHN|nr:MFS transporter [Sphingomonas spermidinifaciens]